jgi:hypothetical protein
MIDVPDHLPSVMHRRKGPSDIDAGVQDERKLGLRKTNSPAFGRVEQMGFLKPIDARH